MNGWKGYAPVSKPDGDSLIVADVSDHEKLVSKGYVRVGDYVGDGREKHRVHQAYYSSSVGGAAAFRQGVAQTVHTTWNGVDARTGQSRMPGFAGLVIGTRAKSIAKAHTRDNDNLAPGEHLVPIFNEKGEVAAYERPMSAERIRSQRQDKNLSRMLGIWSGRILEEGLSNQFNRDLVETLKETWEKDRGTERAKEYVNIAKDPDPVYKDAWDTLGWKIKADAAEVFGEAEFLPIRRDMVEDAVGYRRASVRDAWTGQSRWSPEVAKVVREAAPVVMGKNAYHRLVTLEGWMQDAISYAKTSIVVRSVTLTWENLLSNNLHLLSWGITPSALLKGTREARSGFRVPSPEAAKWEARGL